MPLSDQVFQEYHAMLLIVDSIAHHTDDSDLWLSVLGNGSCAPKNFYSHCFSSRQRSVAHSWIWKSKCVPKLKGFCWLLSLERLNNRGQKELQQRFPYFMPSLPLWRS